mgnify:CR=1 FL=1
MAGCLSASVSVVRPTRLITVPTLRLGKVRIKIMTKPFYLNHITSNFALPLIAKDKIIQLEGHSIMQNKVVTVNGVKNIDPNNVADLKKHLAYQYATIGRYVWLTQDVQCLSVYHDKPEMQSCIVIDTDLIIRHEKSSKAWNI